MKRLLPFLLILASGSAGAVGYYFSDCAGPGGSGTQADPYCLKPPGASANISVAYLADSKVPEFAAGDVAYLCAGACDGSGNATYHVAGTNGIWLSPKANGTSGGEIKIQPYCNSSSCETVTISGDTDGNGTYASGTDVDTFISNKSVALRYFRVDGDPKSSGIPHLIFEKVGGNMFDFTNQQPGIRNVTFNGVEVRKKDSSMWDGGDIGQNCPNNGVGGYTFWLDYMDGGPVTISNSVLHDLCGIPFRVNNNYAAGNNLVITHNVFYNSAGIGTWDNFTGKNSGASLRFANNLIYDVRGGLAISNNMQHVVIEDNTWESRGTYLVDDAGRGMSHAISIDNGRTPNCEATCVGGSSPGGACNPPYDSTYCPGGGTCTGPPDCWLDDIMVRRNRIFAKSDCGGGSGLGCMGGAIGVTGWYNRAGHGDTSFPTGIMIENNMIWGVHNKFGGISDDVANLLRGSLVVATKTNGVVIQNNTISNSRYSLLVSGVPGSGSSIIRNNIVTDAFDEGLWISSTAAGSTIEYNNVYNSTSSFPVVRRCTSANCGSSVTYNCSAVGSIPTLGLGGGSNNICAHPSFVKPTGTRDTWNLHLSSSDTVDKDTGTLGANDDIDKQIRSGAVDIGADEFTSADTTRPRVPTNFRVH